MRIRYREVLERHARAICRIESSGSAGTSALIAEGILDQNRPGRVRWIVVIGKVPVALISRRVIAQHGHANRLRGRIHQPGADHQTIARVGIRIAITNIYVEQVIARGIGLDIDAALRCGAVRIGEMIAQVVYVIHLAGNARALPAVVVEN